MPKHHFIIVNSCFKQLRVFTGIIIACLILTACSKDDPAPPEKVDQTVFMYLPWSINLTGAFYDNISAFKTAIKKGILSNERVIVFISTSATEATMFELVYKNGDCVEKQLKSYTNPPFTTAAGITSILNDVQYYAPASRYGMIIGCHGLGWLPADGVYTRSAGEKYHWEIEGVPLTRFFGAGFTAPEYNTDITTLAKGIINAGLKMEYILFDDCYLSTVEVAYDLKEAANYLIACPTEIMAVGMPYDKIAEYLVGNVDYKSISETFYDFFKNYSTPCGTIAVTKCSELDNLATIMKEINNQFTFDTSILSSVQRMDGYSPVIFFDYGDYVTKLCTDASLLARFEAQLERAVPSAYKKHTEYYYSMGSGRIKINTYSGTTISDPSQHSWTIQKTETAWYKATH